MNLPWRDALGHLPAVLIALGLLLYGYLSLCYSAFYGRLSVDPNDVGLNYAGTLARSSGFAATYLLAVLLMLLLPSGGKWRSLRIVVRFILVAMLASMAGGGWSYAHKAAALVEMGGPVHPMEIDLPMVPSLVLVAIRADPAVVEPAGKPGDFPAVVRLSKRKLLYLGQSGGTAVLYGRRGAWTGVHAGQRDHPGPN